ncbi:YbeF family protein [Lysinibacillus piscis]|uniref:DUF2651 domain-containing protein n=1 Tax=Lysinibacillus piscis TaxID=2518931 RepID=A0ABQ5NL47_9BACI|nr:YbeF family protein [Lysinibacillus sp. KH24]GLC88822.1 hypothetical protein LYSBPC_19490 [Lysinibacillus sp. KH24]
MEFVFAFLFWPIIVVIFSISSFFLVKKWFIAPIITCVIFVILTYTIFNPTFLFWTVIYTILSLLVSILLFFKYK